MSRHLFVLASLLATSGCLESSYSNAPQPLPAAPRLESTKLPAAESIQQPAATLPESAATPADPLTAPPLPLYFDEGSGNLERRQMPLKTIMFDDIKLEIEKDSRFLPSMLTPKIKDLVGRKVRVRGFILPNSQQTMRWFILTRDDRECCFGPGAAIHDCIQVVMVQNRTAEYTTRPITVEGVLTLRESLNPIDGINTWTLYYLDAESAK